MNENPNGNGSKLKAVVYVLNNVAFPIIVTLILLRFMFVDLSEIKNNLIEIKLSLAAKTNKTFYHEQKSKLGDGAIRCMSVDNHQPKHN